MLKNLLKNTKAQSLIEYSIVIGIISVILVSMNPFLKRSYQGMIKTVADQVGRQENADQVVNKIRGGYLVESQIYTASVSDKTTNHVVGNIRYIYDDSTRTESGTVADLGFTETPQEN